MPKDTRINDSEYEDVPKYYTFNARRKRETPRKRLEKW
jgi:hypothetical protein